MIAADKPPLTIDAAIDSLQGLFLEYPQVQRGLQRLEWTRRFGRNRFGSYDGMQLIGDTRTGKTRLLEEYRDSFGPHVIREKHIVFRPQKVVMIEMPSPCTLKGVCFTIFDHFGLSASSRVNTVVLVNETLDLLRTIGTELLALDEAHHMFRYDSRDHLSQVADFIKTILNNRVCTVVLSGMPELAGISESNAQLRERMIFKFALRAYRWREQADQLEFRHLLDLFEKQLPFAPIGLGSDKNLALRLWSATGGRPGAVASLIKLASIRVLAENVGTLTLEAFAEAYVDSHGITEDQFNPFLVENPPTDVSMAEAVKRQRDDGEEGVGTSGLRKGKGRQPSVSEVFRN